MKWPVIFGGRWGKKIAEGRALRAKSRSFFKPSAWLATASYLCPLPGWPQPATSALFLLAIGYQLSAISFAQTLTFGLYGRNPDYITPTLEATFPFDDLNLGVQAQRDAVGLGVEQALELGPAGRVSFGAKGNLGFAGLTGGGSLQWGSEVFARGGVGPVALETRLAYATVERRLLWVGDTSDFSGETTIPFGVLKSSGFSGALAGRYRLERSQTLALAFAYHGAWLAEGSFAIRSDATYSFGLGFQNGIYGLLGWKGQLDEEGTLLDIVLRAGLFNQLSAALFLENLKLHLTLAYPLAATLGLEMDPFRLDAAYNPTTGAWSAWLRYTIVFGSEE